jgi:vitamin B12 transporter
MKKIILLGLLTAQIFTTNVFADNELKTSDVFVTATRTPIPKNNVIADTTIISEEEIQRAGSSSLVDLLQRQPGIEISNTGGPGQISSIFLRGTSSGHVVVLIDGLRIDSITSGLNAFSNIPISQIKKIEILRGSASSIYGADAIGGVIQIFTKEGNNGFHPYINIGYGRYNTKSVQTGISAGNENTTYSINIAGNETTGFSSYKTNDQNLNDKDGFKNVSFSASLLHKFNDDHQINFQLFNSNSHNHYDLKNDPAHGGNWQNFNFKNQMVQEAYSISLKDKFLENWSSTFKLGKGIDKSIQFQKMSDAIYDSSFPYTYISGGLYYASKDKNITNQNQLSWQNDFKLPLGNLTLLYDQLDQKLDSDTAYNKTKRNNKGYMLGYLINNKSHDFQLNYREDNNSAYKTSKTGSLGYSYHINEEWKSSIILGKAFKSPSFDFLYYPYSYGSYSNPNLKPEESKNFEVSLKYQKDNEANFSITAYNNKIKNLISNRPIDPTDPYSDYIADNINNAEISGLQFSTNKFLGHFLFKGSLTIQSAENTETNKKLNLRASHFGNLGMNYYIGDWNMGIESIGSGSKFQDSNNAFKIPGYVLINLVADYRLNNEMKFNLRLENLLNKNYALAYDTNNGLVIPFQTPGTSFFINLRYEPQ